MLKCIHCKCTASLYFLQILHTKNQNTFNTNGLMFIYRTSNHIHFNGGGPPRGVAAAAVGAHNHKSHSLGRQVYTFLSYFVRPFFPFFFLSALEGKFIRFFHTVLALFSFVFSSFSLYSLEDWLHSYFN